MRPGTERAAAQNKALDRVADQHRRLIAWLKTHGCTSCADLTRRCDVPSVTSRISELVRMGWPIKRTRGYVLTERGARRRATFYQLVGRHPQADLFEAR